MQHDFVEIRRKLAQEFLSYFPALNKLYQMPDGTNKSGQELTESYLAAGGKIAEQILDKIEAERKKRALPVPPVKNKQYNDGLNRHQRRAQASMKRKNK